MLFYGDCAFCVSIYHVQQLIFVIFFRDRLDFCSIVVSCGFKIGLAGIEDVVAFSFAHQALFCSLRFGDLLELLFLLIESIAN